MLIAFYLAAAVAILATTIAITRNNAVHALLYLIVSLLAVAVIFYVIGAPFLAALELIIYAGAIMVLFLFVVMMLNVGELHATEVETEWLKPGLWAWPSALATLLIAELAYVSFHAARPSGPMHVVTPKEIGISLFGPYAIAVELASLLLMSGLVGAYHLGRRSYKEEEQSGASTDGRRVVSGSDVVRAGSDRTSHAA